MVNIFLDFVIDKHDAFEINSLKISYLFDDRILHNKKIIVKIITSYLTLVFFYQRIFR